MSTIKKVIGQALIDNKRYSVLISEKDNDLVVFDNENLTGIIFGLEYCRKEFDMVKQIIEHVENTVPYDFTASPIEEILRLCRFRDDYEIKWGGIL